MNNNRVLIPVLHVAHNVKCFFALCILALLSTTIVQLYFITKITTFGLYEYKVIWQNTRTSQFASSGYWKLILDRYFDRGTSADFRN